MKFKVKSREHGYNIKRDIFKMERECQYVTLFYVKDQTLDHIAIPDDLDYVWDIRQLRLSRKARVRYGKRDKAWYLYLPEPEYMPNEPVETPKVSEEIITINSEGMTYTKPIPDIYGRRKCIVRRKKSKDEVKEELAYFDTNTGWYHREFKDSYGETHIQTLGMCEFTDGHIERVDFKSVIFKEWE